MDPDGSKTANRAIVGWEGTNPQGAQQGKSLRLYVAMWENPMPGKLVAHIDYISAKTRAAPFCVAMTVEQYSDAAATIESMRLLLDKEMELFSLDNTMTSLVEIETKGATPLDVANASLHAPIEDPAFTPNEWAVRNSNSAGILHLCNQKSKEAIQLLLQHYTRVVMKQKGDRSLYWISEKLSTKTTLWFFLWGSS